MVFNAGMLSSSRLTQLDRMAEYLITADWTDGIAFDAHIGHHTVRMDSAAPEGNDTGPSPKRMVLAALIACTGMDVASLLRKMRVAFTSLHIEGKAPITAEHPKTFEHVELQYTVAGQSIDRAKVEKAITLSQERYCGVSAMIRKHCEITWQLDIIS